MIHAYHVIIGAYGFWLPNDPRGSWSDFVGKWELVRFGRSTKSSTRRELTPEEEYARQEAKRTLKYPPVQFTGVQARGIGMAFADLCQKRNYSIWACSILPEHTHLVIARHIYTVESIVTLLKGEAMRRLVEDNIHPLAVHARPGIRPPKMWARNCWKVFLDTQEAIDNAIRYVQQNPIKEGVHPTEACAGLKSGGHAGSDWSYVNNFNRKETACLPNNGCTRSFVSRATG